MEDIAIRVQDVSKLYKLYDKPSDRLKESLGLSRKKHYKEHYALHNVSFDVKRGETVGIIGTNGSGKSTILKIITGVLNPSGGQVEINGRISALLELGAGFNQEYTGLENVYLNGTMIGFTREEIDAKLDDILSFADIGDFINQPVKTYSSGMFVRLAFAVAINIDPEILIVDEALSVGDVFFQAKCYKKFEEFKEQGKTVLFVSHDLGSVNKYCDRVVLLNKGRKVAEGDSKEIIDMYKRILANPEMAVEAQTEGAQQEKVSRETREDDGHKLWMESMLMNPDKQEYGDRDAVIQDFGIFDELGNITNSVNKLEKFTLRMKVEFARDVDDPIMAFTIRDLKGTELCGTNTRIEGARFGMVRAGESLEISFTQEMRLQRGQYLIQLGCTSYQGDELAVHHRLYDVCCVDVMADKTTVGYFDLNTEIDYRREVVS
ncbi:MAG: ABC transporter ATP-binding protein [Roseburia sp.]